MLIGDNRFRALRFASAGPPSAVSALSDILAALAKEIIFLTLHWRLLR